MPWYMMVDLLVIGQFVGSPNGPLSPDLTINDLILLLSLRKLRNRHLLGENSVNFKTLDSIGLCINY